MVKVGEFKGKPVLTLLRTEEDPYPFTFGMGKARLILAHLEEIKHFVDVNNVEADTK